MVKKVIWALASGLLAGGVSYFYGEQFEQQLFEDYSTFSHPAFLYTLLKKYNCEPTYYNYL